MLIVSIVATRQTLLPLVSKAAACSCWRGSSSPRFGSAGTLDEGARPRRLYRRADPGRTVRVVVLARRQCEPETITMTPDQRRALQVTSAWLELIVEQFSLNEQTMVATIHFKEGDASYSLAEALNLANKALEP
jgi:hypothetical protein